MRTSNKIYIKLIDIKHSEVKELFEEIEKNYKTKMELNKDTYSVEDTNNEIYKHIIDIKNDFGAKGKLMMVFKGSL